MSTVDYGTSIIQQLWFILKVQLFLELKIEKSEEKRQNERAKKNMWHTVWKRANKSAAKEQCIQWRTCAHHINGQQKEENEDEKEERKESPLSLQCCILACSIVINASANEPTIHMHCYVIVQRFFFASVLLSVPTHAFNHSEKAQHNTTIWEIQKESKFNRDF